MKGMWGAAAAALAACALLAGCGGSSTPADARPPVKKESPREVFLGEVAGLESWQEDGPEDDEITEFAKGWCAAIGQGHSVEWLLEGGGNDDHYPVGWEWGTKLQDARLAVVAAVRAYCPEFRSDVVAELRENGDY